MCEKITNHIKQTLLPGRIWLLLKGRRSLAGPEKLITVRDTSLSKIANTLSNLTESDIQ